MDATSFAASLSALGLTLTPAQAAQFATYYEYLVAENEKVNLTALTSVSDVYLKHFYDSLTLVQAVPALRDQPLTVCDVGAGAGFPSLPLKLLFPQLQVTIVDSLQKRIDFLARLTAKLGLTGVTLVHDRAETFGGKKAPAREAFDLVTARAVANLATLAEFCLPLTRVGGQFAAMKGAAGEAELKAAAVAIHTLGGGKPSMVTLELPETGDERSIVVVPKARTTPARYPRKPGTPAKQPLH